MESKAREGSDVPRACGMPQETSIARSQIYCYVHIFGFCSASLKLLFWSIVCCGRVDALSSVRRPGQMMGSPGRGGGLWRKGLNEQFTLWEN